MYLQHICDQDDFDILKKHILKYGSHSDEKGGYTEITAVITMVPIHITRLLGTFCNENNTTPGFLIGGISNVIDGMVDFTSIPGSEYYKDDYVERVKCFSRYLEDHELGHRTSRQFVYHADETGCFHSFQFLPKEGTLMVDFRSCDLIHKFIPDVLMLLLLCEKYNLHINKFELVFGSLHIYDKDVEK